MQRLAPNEAEQVLRNYLGGFGFAGDRINEKVKIFSGGEKARLVLAILAWQRPNLLLLDEPTNHLDIEMRHALSMALQDYNGAMVIVSHDRHMLRSACDEFLLVGDGQVQAFDGDLEDYHLRLNKRLDTESANNADIKINSAQSKKLKRQQEAEKRQRLQPLQKKLNTLENTLEKLNNELNEIESALAEHALYQAEAKEKLTSLLTRQRELKIRRDEIEEEWLILGEELQLAEENES